MPIREYINRINNLGFYGGELEISIANQIYDINIATYREHDNIGFSTIRYYNNERDENRHLLILLNINNNHFRLG